MTTLPLSRTALAVLVCTGLGAKPLVAQAGGTVSGVVRDATSATPLSGVRITVAGTQLQSETDIRGMYRLTNVPGGQVTLAFRRLGFAPVERTFTVTAGGQATQDVQLTPSVVTLGEVVVTGTAGEQTRRAQGAQIAEISVSNIVQAAPVRTIEQVLQSREPGVSVTLASGTSGAFSAIRIRGGASISLNNDPVIIVDESSSPRGQETRSASAASRRADSPSSTLKISSRSRS